MLLPVGGSDRVCMRIYGSGGGKARRGGDRRQREIRAREADAGGKKEKTGEEKGLVERRGRPYL